MLNKKVVLCLVFALLVADCVFAGRLDCPGLWEGIGAVSGKDARSLYDGAERDMVEGVWKTDDMTFLVLKAPANDCGILYRMIVVSYDGGIYALMNSSQSGSIIGLMGGSVDGGSFTGFYKSGPVRKPRVADIVFDMVGSLRICGQGNEQLEILAKKIYPKEDTDISRSPLNGPIPRN